MCRKKKPQALKRRTERKQLLEKKQIPLKLKQKQENPGKRRERRGNIQTSAAVKWMKFQTAYRLL